MLFYSFFKTLVGQEISVHLKNNVVLTGKLVSVDQFLNIKLDNLVVDQKYPQLVSLLFPKDIHIVISKELFVST